MRTQKEKGQKGTIGEPRELWHDGLKIPARLSEVKHSYADSGGSAQRQNLRAQHHLGIELLPVL